MSHRNQRRVKPSKKQTKEAGDADSVADHGCARVRSLRDGWGAKSIGLVQSSFLWGYMLTPLLGGVLADTYGGKAVLGGGILLWSLATIATPFAAMTSLPLLLVSARARACGKGRETRDGDGVLLLLRFAVIYDRMFVVCA